MNTFSLFPAILGFTLGVGLYPFSYYFIKKHKIKTNLTKEERRLKETSFILSAQIEDGNFSSHLIKLLEDRRQGVLHLSLGRRRGYLVFKNGAVVDAYYRTLTGVDALKVLLTEEEGRYFFEQRVVYQPSLTEIFSSDIEKLLNNNVTNQEQICSES